MKLNRVVLIASVGVSLACAEDVDSEDIRTQGMYAIYEAVADGSGDTVISTQIRVGGDNGTFVRLTGEDELTASTNDDSTILRHQSSGNRHYYKGTIEGDEGGLEIQIGLARGEDNDDALDSFATLPEPFEADLADPDLDEITRGDDVSVVWDNDASGKMKWSLDGDCVHSISGSTTDDGSLTIDGSDVEVWESDKGESCEVTIVLDRVREGETDPAFEEGGEYDAIQRREVTFISKPAQGE